MLGLRCIYGYLIIYLLSNHLKRSVYSSDPNNAGEGTSNSTLLAGSSSQEGPISQSATTDENSQPNQPKAEDGKPKEGDSKATPVTSVTVINLDININQTTDQYNISDHNGVVKFTPKYNHVFGKVVDGSIDIWKSKGDVYVSLVMTKTGDNVKYLAMLFQNNMFKLFKQVSGKPWAEITDKRHDITMLKFIGDNDTELKSSDYIVTIFDLSYEFTFKSGVNCRKIMYGEDDLWKHTDDDKFAEIKSLSLGLITNKFFVSNNEFQSKQLTKAKLTLDIDKTEGTDQYDYTDESGVVTYKPKDNHVINKVTQGTNDIWESKDNLCGTLISTKSEDNKKYLAILLENNMFRLFHLDNNEWKDITSKRHDISKLKFLGESDTELTSSDYKVSIVDLSFTYLFKSGANCRKVKYDNIPMWKHTDDSKFSEIKSFQLDLPTNKFFVKNQSDESKKLDIKIILDLNTNQSTSEFDYTDQNGVLTYIPKDDFKFSKLVEGTTDIWESKDDVNGILVRIKVSKGVKFLVVLLDNNKFTVFHLEGNEWKDITSDRHDVTKLKFLDDNDVEITNSDYTLTIVDLSYTYLFNSGVSCRKIKLGGGDVWKHTDDPKFSEIKSFQLDLPTNKFFVKNFSDQIMHIGAKISLDIQKTESTDDYEYLKDDDCHTFTPKSGHIFNKISQGITVVWESTDCLYGTLVRTKVSKDVKYLGMLLTNNMFKVFKLDGNEWQDVTNQRRDITNLKFLGDNDYVLKSSDYTVSIVDLLYTFTFNSGIKCKMITYCDDEVWNHSDDPKFSEIKKFRLGLVSNSFFVVNASEFKKVDIKLALDIDKTQSTEKYYFNDQNGVLTFTPNSGYVFKKVSKGTTDIWESKDNLYGTMTMTMTLDNKKFLTILLDNNTFTLFHLDGNDWKDITNTKYDVKKLKFYGENDTELKSCDYKVTLENDSYTYIFNEDAKCVKVTYSDLDVWKHSDDTDYSDIKSFSLGLARNKFYVNNSSDEKKEVDIKVSLDIEKKESTDDYEHSKDGNFHKYIPKSDYVFDKVVKKITTIWESTNLYGTLVMTKDESGLIGKDIHVVVLLTNDMFTLLHSSDKGNNWNDITNDKHDISKLKFFGEGDAEITSSDFTVSIVDFSYTFAFNTGVSCRKIIYNNIPIWNNTDDPKFGEIKSFQLDLPTNKFFVKNSSDEKMELKTMVALNINTTQSTNEFDHLKDDDIHTYTPKSGYVFSNVLKKPLVGSAVDVWESKDDLYGTLVVTKDEIGLIGKDIHVAILLKNNTFVLLYSSDKGKNWEDITNTKYDVSRLKFLGENGVVLKASDYTVTFIHLSYELEFKVGVSCRKIIYNNIPIWNNTDDPKFGEIKSFQLDLPTNKFFVKNSSDEKMELKDITMISLDIDKKDSTYEFDHLKDVNFHTYTPKSSYVFNKVSQGTKDIWESKNNMYSTLVRVKVTENIKYLVVLMTNNMFKLFELDGSEWKDVTKDRYDVSRLKFFGVNDTDITSSDYIVTIVFLSYEFTFNSDVKCRKIKLGDVEVWKDTDDTDFAEIKSFSLGLSSNAFFVKNQSDQSKKIDKELKAEAQPEHTTEPAEGEEDEEEEEKVPEFKPNEFKLLTTDQSGKVVELPESDYIHNSDRDEHTYDLNNDVKCNEIKYENKTVWKLESGSEDYPLYFTYKIEQYKFIVTFENKFIVCTFENGEWKEKVHSLEKGQALPETKEMTEINTTVLDLNDLKNDKYYDTVENGNVLTFTPKNDGEFSGVIRTTGEQKVTWTVVWQIQGEFELAKNISFEDFGGGRQVLILDTRSGKKMLYRPKEGEFWKEVAEQPQIAFETVGALIVHGQDPEVDLIEIDIKDSEGTKNYDYLESDADPDQTTKTLARSSRPTEKPINWNVFKKAKRIKLYTPPTNKYKNYSVKDGKGIRKVKDSDEAEDEEDDDDDEDEDDDDDEDEDKEDLNDGFIWFSPVPYRYATHVSFKDTANRYLAILLITANPLIYNQSEEDDEWNEITSDVRGDFFKLSLFTKDEDNNKYRAFKSDQYTPSLLNLSYVFTFDQNVECRKITYDGKSVWIYDNHKDFGSLKQVHFGLISQDLYVVNANDDKEKIDKQTEERDSSGVTETEETTDKEDETEELDSSDVTKTKEPTATKETEEETPKKEPKKQLTLVQLNLIETTGSDNFKYVKKNEFATYKAKSHCLFNKVIRSSASAFSKEELFWESEADSEKHVKMVRLKLSDNHIALLLNTGEFILFHKESEEQPWKDITDQRHNFSGFKFFTFDQNDSEYKELDSSSYTMGFNEFSYGVSFNVECHQIKHNDKLIYNYESDEDFGFLKGVYLGLSSNKFFLTNLEEDNKRLDLDKEVIPPKPKPKLEPDTTDETSDIVIQELPEQESDISIPYAKLTSLDINDTNNTPKYQFSDNGIYKTLTARHGNGFNEVKTGNKSIWKSDNDDFAIKVRLKEASTGEKYLLLLFVSKNYQFFYSSGKNAPFEDITDTKHSFNDIKLFSKNDTTNVYQQLDPRLYNISLYHLSLGYRAKEGQKFHLVKLGNDVVYNYKDDVNFGDLRAAYLDLIENNLYVMNMNDQTKVVKELSRLKTAIIDLNKSESTDHFHCTKDGDLVTYTSIGNKLFDKLIRSSRLGSDAVIWKVSDNIYATKVVVDGQGKKGKITNTILHLENGDIKHLNYLDGKWIEVSNKISLDITKSQSSDEFDYSVDGEFKTFNSKSSFLFNSLVEPDTSGSEIIIWKTTNPSEYGNKLVLKDSGDKKYLAMLRMDNKFLLLHKDTSSQNWEDISNTRLNLSDLKMFYFDNKTTGYLLLKDDQYSLSLEKFLYGYEFGAETKCHLVKYRDSVIWNHGDDPKLVSLKSVFLNLLNNKITVSTPDGESNEINIPGIIPPSDIEDESKEDGEDSGTAEPTQISSEAQDQGESSTPITILPGNLIELDITKTESTDNYEYIESNDNHVYTVKSGFGFSKIKKGDHDLKECTSPHYYCKVVANYGQHNKIILYVYKTDKDFDLLLLDDPDPSSRDITSLPSDTVQALQGSGVVSEQLKLLALDDHGQSKELDHNKLNVEELTHLVNYTFEPDTKCSEIKYNDKTVWKYDKSKHGRYYPTNILMNTTTSFILVESQGHYQYYYTYINDEWRCISGYKTQDLQPLYLDKLTIFTLNQFGLICVDDATHFNKSVSGPITSFILNPGFKCISVKYGDLPVWSYNYNDHEDKYPSSVIVNIDEKTVMVDCSGTYRYLFSYTAGQFSCVFAFKSRLIDPIDPEKLKFFNTDASGAYIELDKSKYDIEEPDTEYKFTSDARCTCIKYDNTEVWKHKSQHKDKYPTSVSFNNRNRNYLVVESSRSYRNMFQFQNTQFKLLGANQKLNYDCNSTGVFDPDKLKFMTTDPSDPNHLVELDYTKYTVESPSFVTYKFNSVLCKEIGYDNQLVWKYDENEHSDDFPTTVSINLKKSYVIVDSSHFYRYVYSYYDKKWKELPFGFKTTNISFDKFKLLTTDPINQNKLVELDPSQYEMEYSQNVLAIKFNTNVKCTCIMYNNKDVWKYRQNEHEGKYPTTTVFNKKKSIVLVDSGYHYRYLYIYQNKEWKPLPYGYTLRLSSSKYQLFDTKKLQVFTLDKNNTLVLIPINEYDKEDTATLVSYVFRYSKNCHCVKYDQKVVWEYKQDEHEGKYPPRITLNKKTNVMLIESGYDYRYMFQFENGEWKLLPFSYRFKPKTDLVDPEKIKLLTLDNDENSVELEQSKYKKEDTNNVITFKIKDGVKCTSVKYNDNDVWKYNRGEHGDKYPTKISLNKNKKFLLVESGYDYRYLFHFENDEWKLLPFGNKFKTTQSYNFDSSKLKLCSIDNSNNPFELDYSKYDRVPNGNILTYTLNPDVKCTEVKYDNTSAWNYDDDEHENNYPTTIIFNRNNGFLIVESKDNYESYYSYYDNKWHSVYGYKASKITKNKEFYKLKLYETNEDGLLEPITGFHEEIIGTVITCNISNGVKCTHVKYDEKTAWTYDYEKHMDHYPTSVVFNITNSTIKVECEDKYVYFSTFINDEWKPFGGYRTQRTNARPEVKLYQKDKSGNYAYINPSRYNVNWDGENDVYEYDLNNLSCALLKRYENTVWSQTSNEHPKSITYNSDQSKFVLRFDDQYIFCSFEDNQWKKMSRRYGTQSTKKSEQDTPTEDSTEAKDSTQPETEDKEPEPAIQPETEQDSTQTEQQPEESKDSTTGESSSVNPVTLSGSKPGTSEQTESTNEQDSTQTETESTNEQETEETEEPKQESSQPEPTVPEESTSD